MQVLIHQKDIQRGGGVCAKYPVSCLVRDLLADAEILQPFKKLRVLDLTFGEGRFWVALPQVYVVGFDIQRLKWVRRPQEFYLESAENWKKRVMGREFDLVVADPPFSPYRRGWEKRGHYRDNGSMALILYEARKASIHFNAPLLIHFLGRLQFYGFKIVAETWFQGWSRLANMPLPTWFGILRPLLEGAR